MHELAKSFINGSFDDDCFQELSINFINCIKSFSFKDIDNIEKYFK